MVVLIDNGHGKDTAGKRSPDGKLREYAYTREIAVRLEQALKKRGIEAIRITPEENDVSLSERCRRANKYGAQDVILVSIHCNAAGNGSWMNARGWEAWTSVGNTRADKLATCLYEAAGKAGFKLRKDETDGDPDKEGHLYILKHTVCPAVLTENLFQDNREDVEYLLSETGKQTIVDLHVNGITAQRNETVYILNRGGSLPCRGLLARQAPRKNTATAGQYTGRNPQGNRLCTRYCVPRNPSTDSGEDNP